MTLLYAHTNFTTVDNSIAMNLFYYVLLCLFVLFYYGLYGLQNISFKLVKYTYFKTIYVFSTSLIKHSLVPIIVLYCIASLVKGCVISFQELH